MSFAEKMSGLRIMLSEVNQTHKEKRHGFFYIKNPYFVPI